ncbi:hypothetical protein Hanom_Chr11g01049811 [Helianthus anomalus]
MREATIILSVNHCRNLSPPFTFVLTPNCYHRRTIILFHHRLQPVTTHHHHHKPPSAIRFNFRRERRREREKKLGFASGGLVCYCFYNKWPPNLYIYIYI